MSDILNFSQVDSIIHFVLFVHHDTHKLSEDKITIFIVLCQL